MSIYRTLRSVVRFGRIETNPVERRLARAASVADLRRIARRRLPGGVFDYIDGGAEDEATLVANSAAFAAVTFRPRVLRGVAEVDVASTILGQPMAFPLVLAPPASAASPTPPASSPSPAPPPGPGCPTRSPRSALDRSRRCATSAAAGCGSRCTRGGTAASSRR